MKPIGVIQHYLCFSVNAVAAQKGKVSISREVLKKNQTKPKRTGVNTGTGVAGAG